MAEMLHRIAEGLESVQEELRANDVTSGPVLGPDLQARKITMLRSLLTMENPVLRPVLDAVAPLGHAYPEVSEVLDLEPGHEIFALEDLADLGVLERTLRNQVHTCPACRHCQINFRESCPSCSEFHIDIERLIHHFHCAYCGLESEFVDGIHLTCPKCRRRLHQLGQDFERPHDTYVCRGCEYLFEEPSLEGQCLSCGVEFPSHEADTAKIYEYRPTVLAARAVELNRLTGLRVSDILFDSDIRMVTREFLVLEVEREVFRMIRYGGKLSAVVLSFRLHDREYALLREWTADFLKDLGTLLTDSLRGLDLVARLSETRIGLLLPVTDADGVAAVKKRLMSRLGELRLTTRSGHPIQPHWRDCSWDEITPTKKAVLDFFDLSEVSEE